MLELIIFEIECRIKINGYLIYAPIMPHHFFVGKTITAVKHRTNYMSIYLYQDNKSMSSFFVQGNV